LQLPSFVIGIGIDVGIDTGTSVPPVSVWAWPVMVAVRALWVAPRSASFQPERSEGITKWARNGGGARFVGCPEKRVISAGAKRGYYEMRA
jgi:hypothetical protein